MSLDKQVKCASLDVCSDTLLVQQLKVPALTVYGFLTASSVLGIKGVSVLLVHLGVSFSVAQLRKPALSWVFNLLMLSTLHIQSLQDIQVSCVSRTLHLFRNNYLITKKKKTSAGIKINIVTTSDFYGSVIWLSFDCH